MQIEGGGKLLSEKEVRDEVEKAMGFNPPLSEYIIVTTAPNDTSHQSLALELSKAKSEQLKRKLKITIYGWESLQQEIRGHPEAHKAFDPSFTPQSDRIERKLDELPAEFAAIIAPLLDANQGGIASPRANDVKLTTGKHSTPSTISLLMTITHFRAQSPKRPWSCCLSFKTDLAKMFRMTFDSG